MPKLSYPLTCFLKANHELIRKNDFNKLYDLIHNNLRAEFTGELTDTLLACGIDPAIYFKDSLPWNYLIGSKIKEYIVPDNIEWLDPKCFAYCRELEKVVLPPSLCHIGDEAFKDCMMLDDINLKDCGRLKTIDYGAFSGCLFTNIELPEGLHTIEQDAFERCAMLEKILIPLSVNAIDENAFSEVPKSMVIKCYENSYAKTYAEAHGFKTEYIK